MGKRGKFLNIKYLSKLAIWMDEWKTDFASKRYDSSSLCWRRVASIGPFENVKYFLAIFCKLSSFFSFSFWHGSIQSKVSVWLTVSHLMVGIFCQKKKQQKQFKQLSKKLDLLVSCTSLFSL